MKANNFLSRILIAIALVLAGAMTSVHAQSKIAVLVNSKAITSYEVTQRARFLRITGSRNASRSAAQKELIEEELKLQEAARFNATPSKSQIDSAYASIARRLKMSPSKLTSALGQNGVKSFTLKRRLEAQIAWNRLVQARHRQTTGGIREDITSRLFNKKGGELVTADEYVLQRVVFIVPKKSEKGYASKRSKEAAAFRSSFSSCRETPAVAKTYENVSVRTLGRFTAERLPKDYKKQVLAMSPGSISSPKTTKLGLEMIALCGTREIKVAAKSENYELQENLNEKLKKVSETYLADLRKTAVIQNR